MSRMRYPLPCVLLSVLGLATQPAQAWAAEGASQPRTLAVQNRKHTERHEISGWVGLLPMDAFTKGLSFSGAYTFHFNDVLAWEVLQFTYSHGMDTSLGQDLADLGVGPTPFERVERSLTSSFMLKPIYGKVAVFNRSLVYHEMFFVAGAGQGWLTITQRPVISLGLGNRIYAGQHLSIRFDARDQLYITEGDTKNEVWIAIGACLSLG